MDKNVKLFITCLTHESINCQQIFHIKLMEITNRRVLNIQRPNSPIKNIVGVKIILLNETFNIKFLFVSGKIILSDESVTFFATVQRHKILSVW